MRSRFEKCCKLAIFALALAALASAQDRDLPENAQREIRALLAEKAARNPAQDKMDSHLVHAAEILSGRPVHPDFPAPPGELESVHLDAGNFVEVDIQADVTSGLLTLIHSLGGAVVNAFPEYQSVRARLPLLSVERVAERGEVRQIRVTRRAQVNAVEGPDGSGDIAHEANAVRASFNFNGAGVKVGVLSNGVNSLAAEQAKGNLPPTVNVIPGQAGSGDEGTAMLEIVYTLAPGATLYFATANGGEAQMAVNIQALANAGCNIIVDDVLYFSEGVFQDDVIARAVDAVSAAGAFYFVAAGNSGSLLLNTSGTWQGDFADSGTTLTDQSVSVAVHSFGAANYDTLTTPSSVVVTGVGGGAGAYELMWSDPLGESSNDYDLFITDASGNVLGSSTNVQNGTQDPEEDITGNAQVAGTCGSGTCRIVVVKHAGAATRALFLSTEHGLLKIATNGATYGHAAAASAFGVAATSALYASGNLIPGCTAGVFTAACNHGVEVFSSDGPRQMFYNPDGSAITPGNVLIGTGGGAALSKPDLTAADAVTTGVSGYTFFSGTSAAAPHAAAIAALLLEAVPTLTAPTMRAALAAGAIDIEGPTPNVNAGAGIVMAPAAVESACGYSVGPAPQVAAAGGAIGLSIQAGPNCPWTVAGLPSWISGATSGKGNAKVTITVAANSGASRSATVFLTAGTLSLASASITQGATPPTYLVGDVAPYTSDTAPNFGDGVLNILDIIQELFAVNNVSGYVPAPCSDRFDSMDTFPVDTATTRGGDGVLDIRDLIVELFRADNLDASRPVRTSRGGVCAGGSSGNSISPAEVSRRSASPRRPQGAAQGALAPGLPEPYGAAEVRVPVYLEAKQDLVRIALTFALGDQQSPLRFVAAPGPPASVVQDSQPGVVVAAWLNGVSVRAGERLLLGYVTAPAGALTNLKVYGISASGLDDNREVRLDPLIE
jgi:hypothetical protein